MPKYITTEDLVSYFSADLIPQIEGWIDSVENYIEKETGRVFIADTEASERKYDGSGNDKLFIDDCIEIEEVKVNGEVIEDYVAYPANSLPITWIEREAGFPSGKQNVSVKAKWGYSEECPAEIKLAATVLVVGIINNYLFKNQVQSESYGSYSVSYRTEKQWNDFEQAKEIINRYKRILVG